MVLSEATVKLMTKPAWADTSGPYSAIRHQASIENHVAGTTTITMSAFAVDLLHAVENKGGGAFVFGDWGVNFRPTYGEFVDVGTSCALMAGNPQLHANASIENLLGIDVAARVAGYGCNIGYSYGNPTKPTGGKSYCFNSQGSAHMHKTGGGIVNRLRNVTANGYTLTEGDSHVNIVNTTANVILPLCSSVEVGLTYKIYNTSGITKSVTSPSQFIGTSRTLAANTSRTFINSGTQWIGGY